eukprot:2647023-Prymnesium_polylepis.1
MLVDVRLVARPPCLHRLDLPGRGRRVLDHLQRTTHLANFKPDRIVSVDPTVVGFGGVPQGGLVGLESGIALVSKVARVDARGVEAVGERHLLCACVRAARLERARCVGLGCSVENGDHGLAGTGHVARAGAPPPSIPRPLPPNTHRRITFKQAV